MNLENIPNDARLINALFELCAAGAGNIFGNKSVYREPKSVLELDHERTLSETSSGFGQARIDREVEPIAGGANCRCAFCEAWRKRAPYTYKG